MKRIHHSRLSIVGSAVLGAALLTSGCPSGNGNNGNDNGDADVTVVEMQSIAFTPDEITIQTGETVRWVNRDIVPHTTTSGNPGEADAGSVWDSPLLGAGQTFERTFNEAGEFVYFCRVHPAMMRDARVIVQAP